MPTRFTGGKIVHKGACFDGEHPAIVDQPLWDEVQTALKANASGTSRRLKVQQPSLLVSKLFDGEGRSMTPRLVCQRIADLLVNQQFLCQLVGTGDAEAIQRIIAAGDMAAASLRSGSAHAKTALLEIIVERICLGECGIEIRTSHARIGAALDIGAPAAKQDEDIILDLPAAKVRRGHQLRLVIPGPEQLNIIPTQRDEKLVALMAEAHEARRLILAEPEKSIAAVARAAGKCRTRLGKLAGLGCMAPDIVTAIVEGCQPQSLTTRTLLAADLPLAWSEQRAAVGFA